MKSIARSPDPRVAFTLIELLVVVAVIAILAGLLFAAIPQISNRRIKAVARAEMFEIQTGIEGFRAAYGAYPPDNPVGVSTNQLFYELVGTTNNGQIYKTLDQKYQINTNGIKAAFGINGFINSSLSAKATDERPAPVSFLKELKPDQIGSLGGAMVLVSSEGWTKPGSSGIAPWCYNSSHMTNNPGSYDLWVDLYIGGKTNRICNWSSQPVIVP